MLRWVIGPARDGRVLEVRWWLAEAELEAFGAAVFGMSRVGESSLIDKGMKNQGYLRRVSRRAKRLPHRSQT